MSPLLKRISASPYLLRLLRDLRDCELSDAALPEVKEGRTQLLEDKLESLINEGRRTELPQRLKSIIASLQPGQIESAALAEQALISAKQTFALHWCFAELLEVGCQRQRGQWQTEFAEATIHFALSVAWRSLSKKNKNVALALEANNGVMPGLFVFGMGKLGGYDLNFSSDVDLVAYFDPLMLPVPDAVGKSYVCHQALQEMTRLLGQSGNANFIWRVDWRLRPNASATSLAMSTVAAQDYYHYRASPWHRLALMKARVVAGDVELGNAFLASLDSFIWRQNLDFRALDELAEIKQRINLEHPGLRVQRTWVEPIGEQVEGFNLKLGSGGIREIEFFVNAQQLLLGGRRSVLRTPNTVDALAELKNQGRLGATQAERLTKAYQFLRRIENAVQIHSNQQTHLLPMSDAKKTDILLLLKIDSWSSLVEQLNQTRAYVNQLFSRLFAEQERSQLGPLVWPEDLGDVAGDIVETWENGFQVYGASAGTRHKLKPLAHALSEYLLETNDHSGPDVNEVVVRIHNFFRSLPAGEQYFRLLAESPSLLQSIVPPLLYSPAMTTLLTQSPHIVDCYVHGEWRYPEPFDSAYILQSDNYGEQLERLRRFVNEHLYQLYQQFLHNDLAVDVLQAALTELAQHTLELALQAVTLDMGLSEPPVTVIGMGKIALRRMSPLSDLDLIFVYDAEQTSMEVASRFVNRLQTAVAAPMKEGIVYELDTRLRPSGRSGAPTVSIESFEAHHDKRARTWEHIALMPSRIVAGRRQAEQKLNRIKQRIITRERSLSQLRVDARKMWLRITEHRVGDTPLSNMNSKLRVGGLMQAEYLASCLVLNYGPKFISDSVELEDLLTECLPYYGLEELPEVIQFWRIQQLWERLLGKTEQPLSSLRDSYFASLLEHSRCTSMDELLAKKKRYVDYVVIGLERFFAEALELSVEEMDDWDESSIKWTDANRPELKTDPINNKIAQPF